MNKQEYLSALRSALSGIPAEEIDKSADFWAEIKNLTRAAIWARSI